MENNLSNKSPYSNTIQYKGEWPKCFDVCLKAALERRLGKFPYKLKETIRGFELTDEQYDLYNDAINLITDDLLRYFNISRVDRDMLNSDQNPERSVASKAP